MTTEFEKMKMVSEESQAVGQFLDTTRYTLCEWRDAGHNDEPKYVYVDGYEPVANRTPNAWDFLNDHAEVNPRYEEWEDGFYPVLMSIERILAEHFKIDLDRLEAEKRSLLELIRSRP